MYVTRVPNRGSPPAVLLRESYREDGKVKTHTLANLSRWPERKVDKLQRASSSYLRMLVAQSMLVASVAKCIG